MAAASVKVGRCSSTVMRAGVSLRSWSVEEQGEEKGESFDTLSNIYW